MTHLLRKEGTCLQNHLVREVLGNIEEMFFQ